MNKLARIVLLVGAITVTGMILSTLALHDSSFTRQYTGSGRIRIHSLTPRTYSNPLSQNAGMTIVHRTKRDLLHQLEQDLRTFEYPHVEVGDASNPPDIKEAHRHALDIANRLVLIAAETIRPSGQVHCVGACHSVARSDKLHVNPQSHPVVQQRKSGMSVA